MSKFSFRFLIPINLPPEAMANPEIANLWSEYQLILNEFKEAHKSHTDSRKESDQFKELKNDIGIIDQEKENGKITIFGSGFKFLIIFVSEKAFGANAIPFGQNSTTRFITGSWTCVAC